MTWQDAVELVVARTKHKRFRKLCSGDNPDTWARDRYREQVIAMATDTLVEQSIAEATGDITPPVKPCGSC